MNKYIRYMPTDDAYPFVWVCLMENKITLSNIPVFLPTGQTKNTDTSIVSS